MAITEGDIEIKLSGGAANSDQELSTGGARGDSFSSQSLALVNSTDMITGVTILYAYNVDVDQVDLDFSVDTLTATQGLETDSIVVTEDTKYTFNLGAGKYFTAFIDFDTVGDVVTHSELEFTDNNNTLFSDVLAIDATEGNDQFKVFYVENTSLIDTMTNGKVWISNQTPGEDKIKIAVAPAKNTDATNTNDVYVSNPDVLSYVEVLTEGTALSIPDLLPGDYCAIYLQREVPQNVNTFVAENLNVLSIKVD